MAPAIQRLDAGGWPGSNTHRWGARAFEIRDGATGREVRIHDAIDFQGVGMQPSDMGPTRHVCTPWEALPATLAVPTAEAIRAFYDSTARPRANDPHAVHQPSYSFTRPSVSCG